MEIKRHSFTRAIFSSILISLLFLGLLTSQSGCAYFHMTPLGSAAREGDIDATRTLITTGVNLNEQSLGVGDPAPVRSPMQWATLKCHSDIVRMLIDAGADVSTNSYGWAAIHDAVLCGDPEMVKLLLDNGANINAVAWGKWTPLFMAVEKGNTSIVRVLLDGGANVNAKDLQKAQEKDYTIIVKMLQNAQEERYLAAEKPASSVPKQIAVSIPVAPLPAASSDVTAGSLDFGSYHALVVGNNDYQNLPKLRTAVSDATTMADLLQAKYGFEVRLLLNATRMETLKAIYSYRRTLTNRDNLLIYYAGHGWLDKEADEGYWLPVDAEKQDPGNWISNSTITSSLRAMRAKHVLVVADSCYSGKLARGISVRLRTSDYYQRISRKKARSVMASGGLEPVADEGGNGKHSVFASSLIEVLNENQGVLDATLLFSKIRRPVMLNADQTPEFSDIRKAGHDGGDFLFVPQ